MNLTDKIPFGRATGVGFIIVSSVFAIVNYFTLRDGDLYYPKMIYLSTMALTIGLSMIIFPGGEYKKADIPEGENELKYILKMASTATKVLWTLSLVAGLILGFFVERAINNPLNYL